MAGTGAGATWYLTVGPGRRVPVPNIVGMSEDQAQLALEKQGLDWGTPTRAYSDTVPAGSVVSCQPKVGQKVGLGQAVTAVISRGVETKTVPDVVGKTKDQASAVIKGAGLTLGDVTEQYSASVDSGKVISSDPKAGKVIEHTAKISIVVSKGKEPATIPDVTGQSEDEAKKTLEDAGLKKGKVSKDYSDSVAKGNVISSSPIAGASGYYKGDSVDLTISKGPEKVTIPDVTGKGQDEAKEDPRGGRAQGGGQQAPGRPLRDRALHRPRTGLQRQAGLQGHHQHLLTAVARPDVVLAEPTAGSQRCTRGTISP